MESTRFIGDRQNLTRVGLLAVLVACGVFTASRWGTQWATGELTPWWGNAAGFAASCLLWLWFERRPAERVTPANHLTGAIALLALLPPVAYGMGSTIWWLALVGFAMVLMAGRGDGLIWMFVVLIAIALATLFEPILHVEGAAGETALELLLARLVFALILMGIGLAFRQEVEANTQRMTEVAEELERSNTAQTRFIAQVSHDLRNPLHGVIAMSDLAISELPPGQPREHVKSAQASAKLLLQLLNNVLDLTHAQQDAIHIASRPFELHDVVGDVSAAFAGQARAQGLWFVTKAERHLFVDRVGDPARIGQILMNLLANALKFTTDGGIEVRLLKGDAPDEVVIEVADTGRGVPTADRDRIFQPFEQVRKEDAFALGGAGLGLPISRDLAERMQGTLTVSDNRGGGAIFSLRLPLPVTSNRTGPTDLLGELTSEVPVDREEGPALRVLIVEDDRTNQLILSQFVRLLGHEAVLAIDGVEALEKWTDTIDVVLTDAEMPRMDGHALLVNLRERSNVPVVICSASESPAFRERFAAAGASGHLAKPFVLADVANALRGLL